MELKAAAKWTKITRKYFLSNTDKCNRTEPPFIISCTSLYVDFQPVHTDLLEITVAFRVDIQVMATTVRAYATVTSPSATLQPVALVNYIKF